MVSRLGKWRFDEEHKARLVVEILREEQHTVTLQHGRILAAHICAILFVCSCHWRMNHILTTEKVKKENNTYISANMDNLYNI